MFTGIVEGTAVVKRIEEVNGNRRMALDFGRRGLFHKGWRERPQFNGVCLSAVKRRGSIVFFRRDS